MGICWYCHWGWSKPVKDIYNQAVIKLGWEGPLHYGPSHIVWEDENFDSAEWCLENFDKYKRDYTEEELAVVRWSLEELAKIPLCIRCPQPVDYDEENPNLFPPDSSITMSR